MRQAFAEAACTNDPRFEARLIASNCGALVNWIGIEPAAAELPRLRRAAVATGDPYCLIAYHSLLAQIKAKKGLIESANRSLETARGLLARWPNVVQQGRVAIASSVIYVLQSDYQLGLNTTNGIELCCEIGLEPNRMPALGTSLIKFLQAEFADAQQPTRSICALRRVAEIAGLDADAIALAKASDLCRAIAGA